MLKLTLQFGLFDVFYLTECFEVNVLLEHCEVVFGFEGFLVHKFDEILPFVLLLLHVLL